MEVEPRFDIGDLVCTLSNDKITVGEVTSIVIDSLNPPVGYTLKIGFLSSISKREDEVFKDKEELLTKLMEEDVEVKD